MEVVGALTFVPPCQLEEKPPPHTLTTSEFCKAVSKQDMDGGHGPATWGGSTKKAVAGLVQPPWNEDMAPSLSTTVLEYHTHDLNSVASLGLM